jgi:hypothetical protein
MMSGEQLQVPPWPLSFCPRNDKETTISDGTDTYFSLFFFSFLSIYTGGHELRKLNLVDGRTQAQEARKQ